MSSERPSPDLLATHIARLFFAEQLTKTEIAKRLGISRFRVARLLDDALARGLVRIEFHDPAEIDVELGKRVAERFDVPICLVARVPDGDDPVPHVAVLAADLLHELLQPDEVFGVAWGSTVAATIDRLRPRQAPGMRVVQLAGGTNRVESRIAPSRLAQRASERLGAALHPLFAPAIVESDATRDAILREPDLRTTVALFDHVTTALVGIGAWTGAAQSSVIASGALTRAELSTAIERGAVADLVFHAIDASGGLIHTPLEDRSIAISFDQVRQVPRVVAVATGASKAPAIAAVLRTGAIAALVIDADAARALLV